MSIWTLTAADDIDADGPGSATTGFISASFPVNGILDNFNRANEGPPPSSNWTTAWRPSTTGFKVLANVAAEENPANDNSTYWNVQNFGPDVEVYAVISFGAPDYHGLAARLVGEGTAGVDGYELVVGTSNTVGVYRIDNNAYSAAIGGTIAQNFSNGDSFGMKIVGSTFTIYYKASGGSWTEIGTRTDSTYSAAGKIGMRVGVGSFDDFGGGTL